MDPVGSTDHYRILVCKGLVLEDRNEVTNILDDELRGLFQEQGQGRIQDIRRGEAEMNISRSLSHILGHCR